MLQGVHFRTESESLTVPNPSSGYRCTVIYVRYTKTSGVESVGLYTKAGTTATSESAVVVPTVTSGNIRNGATKAEAVLFRVYSNTSGIYKTEMAADVVSSLASLTSGVSALNSKNAGTTYTSVEDLYNYGIDTPGFKLATITSAVASSLTNGVIASASRIFLCRADNTTVDALLFSLASGKLYLSRISNGVAVKAYTASVTEISLS